MTCSGCGSEIAASARFCASCGVRLTAEGMTAATTEAMAAGLVSARISSSSAEEGRFPTGTLLAGRYRILGLAGRGGMGEVYRATDLRLGQLVALKFLPEATARDGRMRTRLYGEVRIARQVSHPNVCRVYDVGEVDGALFLSMEYVDGEDLRSLLKRIGRLPADKGVEIARKLCAGMAAAHDKGVLHRDLKPANVMIDARGEAVIMDFGLAGVEGQVTGREIRHGTPAYMAPEQFAGKEVTVKSDLYALGLVFYEMFSGRRAFEDGRGGQRPSVSALGKDIDPAVERVIERCLAEDPRGRPASALAVAAGLPGGDPLAAALAMGETPTPEMVAASGDPDAMPVAKLRMWLGLAVVGLAVAVYLAGVSNPMEMMPLEYPPDVLQQKAREVIGALGYTDRPGDSGYRFVEEPHYRAWVQSHVKRTELRAEVAEGTPGLFSFWYRQSPQDMVAVDWAGMLSWDDPPFVRAGMIRVSLTVDGRLVRFEAAPPQVDRTEGSRPVDWAPLLAAAGLDVSKLAGAQPEWTPPMAFDTRAAWTGVFPRSPAIPLRVEAAAWRGRPVEFRLIGPWTRPERTEPVPQTKGERIQVWAALTVPALTLAAAILLALRNYKRERVDIRGANRVACVLLIGYTLLWIPASHHGASAHELDTLTAMVAAALYATGVFWVFYLALEPYVRRRWPQSLVGWGRMLSHGLRDPQVGAQVLEGVVLGFATVLLFGLRGLAFQAAGVFDTYYEAQYVAGLWKSAEFYLSGIGGSTLTTLGILCVFFLLRVLLRRAWLAAAVVMTLAGLTQYHAANPAVSILFGVLLYGLAVLILIRFGILPMAVSVYMGVLFIYVPITTDLFAWYAGPTIASVCIAVGLIAWSFYTGLAGRSVFEAGFLDN